MTTIFNLILILSMINPNSILEESFQCVLNTERLQNLIQEDNKQLPILVVTNGEMPLDLNLKMFDQKVKLFASKDDSDLIKSGHAYLDILKISVKKRSGEVKYEMFYNGIKLKIIVENNEKGWFFKSFYSKNNKNRSYEREF